MTIPRCCGDSTLQSLNMTPIPRERDLTQNEKAVLTATLWIRLWLTICVSWLRGFEKGLAGGGWQRTGVRIQRNWFPESCSRSPKGGIGKRAQKEVWISGTGRISSRQPPLPANPCLKLLHDLTYARANEVLERECYFQLQTKQTISLENWRGPHASASCDPCLDSLWRCRERDTHTQRHTCAAPLGPATASHAPPAGHSPPWVAPWLHGVHRSGLAAVSRGPGGWRSRHSAPARLQLEAWDLGPVLPFLFSTSNNHIPTSHGELWSWPCFLFPPPPHPTTTDYKDNTLRILLHSSGRISWTLKKVWKEGDFLKYCS